MDMNELFLLMPLVQDTTRTVSSSDSGEVWPTLLICVIVWIVYKGFRSRCSSCGKLFAMKTYHEEFDHIEYGIKTETTTYSGNQKIKKTNQATTRYYRMYRRCRHCGHEDVVVRFSIL